MACDASIPTSFTDFGRWNWIGDERLEARGRICGAYPGKKPHKSRSPDSTSSRSNAMNGRRKVDNRRVMRNRHVDVSYLP